MLIIATVGITTVNEYNLRKIVLAGADILRHNFSYYGIEENLSYLKLIQGVIEELHAPTKHLIDLPLNKIRLGDFDSKVFAVRENEEFVFKSASFTPDCNQFIPVNTPKLGTLLRENQTVTLGDGEIAIQVIEVVDYDTVRARILNNGILKFMKTFNIESLSPPNEDDIINTYQNILNTLDNEKVIDINYIALSFIGTEINEKLKQLEILKKLKNVPAKIVIKIEDQTGIDNIEKICQDSFYDIIMIDRGELGVNIPYEKVGIAQKQIIKIAKKYKKPTIISTQILESVVNNYVPARSDILDVTNMIEDGVEGIMLCHETGANRRPAYAISVAKKIINEVRKANTNLPTLFP